MKGSKNLYQGSEKNSRTQNGMNFSASQFVLEWKWPLKTGKGAHVLKKLQVYKIRSGFSYRSVFCKHMGALAEQFFWIQDVIIKVTVVKVNVIHLSISWIIKITYFVLMFTTMIPVKMIYRLLKEHYIHSYGRITIKTSRPMYEAILVLDIQCCILLHGYFKFF